LLGAYLFVEMFTIVDAVAGTWRPWAVVTQTEALKLWFYALAVSVVLDLYEILVVYSPGSTAWSPPQAATATATASATSKGPPPVNEEKKQASRSTNAPSTAGADAGADVGADSFDFNAAKRRSTYRQLIIDGCDLLIPGAAVGWLALDPITVGVAGTISALVGGSDAWTRVNA
jgi:hypothetical protein